jgi:hypothetical protein
MAERIIAFRHLDCGKPLAQRGVLRKVLLCRKPPDRFVMYLVGLFSLVSRAAGQPPVPVFSVQIEDVSDIDRVLFEGERAYSGELSVSHSPLGARFELVVEEA